MEFKEGNTFGKGRGESVYRFRTSEVCDVLGIDKKTFARWRRAGKVKPDNLMDICRLYMARQLKNYSSSQ